MGNGYTAHAQQHTTSIIPPLQNRIIEYTHFYRAKSLGIDKTEASDSRQLFIYLELGTQLPF